MVQTWRDLLFAHWPVPVAQLRALVPPALQIDTFGGEAWVAVTPLYIDGLRMRWLPPLPLGSMFAELNVRTYVTVQEKPGVYFFSLDAASPAAVLGARMLYRLPYYEARMSRKREGSDVVYSSARTGAARAEFAAKYRPTSEPRPAQKGTLEHFLTERYCLYTTAGPSLYRAEIHHVPWPLQDASAGITQNTMAAAAGIDLPAKDPLLHFARELKVYVWPLQRVKAPAYVKDLAMKPI